MLDRLFHLKRLGTSARAEVLAGATTFVTMAYIIVVNPAILEAAGIPRGPSMVATILTAAAGCLVMGLWANRPFAIAPYMGENAFIAYTVCQGMGFSWQTALGAVFLSGVAFIVLTVTRLRAALAESIPVPLRYSFAVGIGLFLAFIGLNEMGVVTLGAPSAPVRIGDLGAPATLIAVGTFIGMELLLMWRVPGAILLAILGGAAAAFLAGAAPPPEAVVSPPPSLAPVFARLDLSSTLSFGFLNVALVVFVMAFLDTIATLIGVSSRAGFLDADGHLPGIERPMLADAVATTLAGVLGTTTAGAYIESAAGVEAGGRSGLTALVVGALFLLALFFAPVLTAIPPCAYGPALVVVGLLMIQAVTRIPFDRLEEAIPALAVMILMSFTYNIAIGMTSGFVLYPVFMTAAGRAREVRPGLWALAALSVLLFVFYPTK